MIIIIIQIVLIVAQLVMVVFILGGIQRGKEVNLKFSKMLRTSNTLKVEVETWLKEQSEKDQ